jgi:hypothetical protein
MRPVLLSGLVLLIATPAAHADITWPKATSFDKGDRVSVGVDFERRARVSLVSLSAQGKPLRTLARRTLRKGTFSAELTRFGKFELRVVVAGKRHKRVIEAKLTCPNDHPGAMSITLGATSVTAGGTLPYTLENISDACLDAGYFYGLERQAADGSWVPLPVAPAIAVLMKLPPGGKLRKEAVVPAGSAPGHYRVVDRAKAVTDGDVTALAEFDVTA